MGEAIQPLVLRHQVAVGDERGDVLPVPGNSRNSPLADPAVPIAHPDGVL